MKTFQKAALLAIAISAIVLLGATVGGKMALVQLLFVSAVAGSVYWVVFDTIMTMKKRLKSIRK